MPPLAIALALLTAATMLLTAAAIAEPPMPVAHPAAPPAPAAAALPDPTVTALLHSDVLALPAPSREIDLARLVYAPGIAGPTRHLPGPLTLVVESGALTVDLAGAGQLMRADQGAQSVSGRLVLQTGDSLALPTATGAAFASAGVDPAVALAAGVFPSGVTASKFGRVRLARWGVDWSPGASVQPLAGGGLIDTAAVSATVTLHRLSLEPGTQAPLTASGAVELAVETGALTLTTGGGLVWLQRPTDPGQFIEPAHIVTLLPGDAALLQEEASVTLRNAGSGPLLVLALTVEPDRGNSLVARRASPAVIPDPHTGLPARYWRPTSATPAQSAQAAPPRGLPTQPRHDVAPQRYLAQMTAVQHRQGLPLPGAVGRLPSLIISATPVTP